VILYSCAPAPAGPAEAGGVLCSVRGKGMRRTMIGNRCGFFCGARIPLGYRTVPVAHVTGNEGQEPPRRPVPSDEVPIALKAFETFARTRSLSQTRDYLRHAAPNYCLWHMGSVRTMLTNPFYRGVLTWGPNRNAASHEAIIPEELWDAVQAIFAAGNVPARGSGYRMEARRDRTLYFLRGKIYCHHCGCRMTPAFAIGRGGLCGYYECGRNQKKRLGPDGTPYPIPIQRVNAFALHAVILSEIQRAGEHPSRLDAFIRAAVRLLPSDEKLKAEAETLRRKVKDAEKRLGRLMLAIERGGAALSPLLRRIADVEKELMGLTTLYQEATQHIAEASLNRPDTAAVASYWRYFGLLWEELKETERA